MPLIQEYFLFTLQKIRIILNLFNLSLKLNGFPIKKAKIALKTIQEKTNEDFDAYLTKKKQDIVSYHLKNNPFYKEFSKGMNLKNWGAIPVMTKRDLQQPLRKRLSKGYSNKNIYISKTSGSSGDPFIFAKDKFSHALTWAIIQDYFSWFGIDFNTSKQARFYGIPLDRKGYYKERIKDVFSNRFRFSVFDLSDTALEVVLKKFKTTPFDYINGYTSSIVQFAKFLKRKNIVLKRICPTLKYCVVTSEILFKNDRNLLETQFEISIINEYGAAELGLIAFENQNHEWVVNNQTLFVEILDTNNQPQPYGKEGRIVITSLYNKAHPFIRYDIGDIGVLSKNSTSQKPILEKLIGRTNDIAVLPSGKKAAGLTFYYITKSIIEDDGNVKEFIVEQLAKDTFKIKYTGDHILSSEKEKSVLKEMETYLEKGLKVIFEKHSTLKRSKSGKLKQFKSFL